MSTQLVAPDAAERSSAAAGPWPETSVSRFIERTISAIGEAASWLWFVLVIVIVVQVTLRYAFGRGYVVFEEIMWHIYGVAFIIGLSFAAVHERHVRVDVLSEMFPLRLRSWIELLGCLFLLLPFSLALLFEAIPFVETSFRLNEVSPSPGGLPLRWIAKSFIIAGAALLALAAFARLTRVTAFLFGFPKPLGRP